MKSILQPELNLLELLAEPVYLNIGSLFIKVLRFSKIFGNSHPWMIPAHAHPNIELHYILSGRGLIKIEEHSFEVGKDDIYIALPYVSPEQNSSAHQVMEEFCIECTISFGELEEEREISKKELAALQEYMTIQPHYGCHAGKNLFQNLLVLEQELNMVDFGWFLKVQLLFGECITEAFRTLYRHGEIVSYKKLPSYHQKIAQRMKSYLEMFYRQQFSVEEMAGIFYLSPKQMNRIFQGEYGMTIREYLSNLRRRTALSYIKKGELSMREIALECGFSGYQQMYRALKEQKK